MASNFTYTREEVEQFDLEKACEIALQYNLSFENLETAEELQMLIKKNFSLLDTETPDRKEWQRQASKDSPAIMEEILKKDHLMKESLSSIYHSLIRFLSGDMVGDDIKEVLRQLYEEYTTKLASYSSELVNDECPIVVAGETSAGKSSLLNLILGTDVLPHSLLCATSTICCLHNSETKKFVIEENGQEKEILLDKEDCSAEKLKEKLSKYVSVTDDVARAENPYHQVDIYWPIPMLQDRVTIVDTPGIGESDKMTERLLHYLPNAVAFIYVINSAIAGGVQDDKLVKILQEPKKWEREGKLATFDHSCAIFVCNKWDQVEDSKDGMEEQYVWKDTLMKLRKVWANLDESQVFKMSTTEAARRVKYNLEHTDKFVKFMEGIERLVPASLMAKIDRHFKWLQKFIATIQSTITSRINNARSSEQEKKKLQETVLQRITTLRLESDNVRMRLNEKAKSKCDKIADKLYDHLHSEETMRALCSWNNYDAPDLSGNDLEVTKFNASKTIKERIQEAISKWEEKHNYLKNVAEDLDASFKAEFKILETKCDQIDVIIKGKDNFQDISSLAVKRAGKEKKGDLFSSSEKVMLAVTSPLWFPLAVTASVLFLPVLAGLTIKESLKEGKERKKYVENKAQFMEDWTKEILTKNFNKENISHFINDVYLKEFEDQILEVCVNFVPAQINADEKLVNDIATDMRSSKEILKQYQPLQVSINRIAGQLLLFSLRHITPDLISVDSIEKKELLGRGSFSDVYSAKWKKSSEEVCFVAVKELRDDLNEDQLYSQLSEVTVLKTLNHENIVDFMGVIFLENETSVRENQSRPKYGRLMLVMELCEDDLQRQIFDHQERQCKTYNNTKDRQGAFKYYVSMATGICEGLHYMHEQEYIHRDLKLTNILIQHNVPKICDVGLSKKEHFITGTFAGTISHVAPEMWARKPYSFSADIYSLGIMLWEMWYGAGAYTGPAFEYGMGSLISMIENGLRPLFQGNRFRPWKELEDLMKKCWDKDPKQRPAAREVAAQLDRIYKCYYLRDQQNSPSATHVSTDTKSNSLPVENREETVCEHAETVQSMGGTGVKGQVSDQVEAVYEEEIK